MSTPFDRTLQALEERGVVRKAFPYLVGGLVLGGWILWALAAEVTVVEVSSHAVVEAYPAPLRLHSPVDGVVVATHVEVGAQVEAGQILVTLDPSELEARLDGF